MRAVSLSPIPYPFAIVTLVLPFLCLGFVVGDHVGFWHSFTGLDQVQAASDRFGLSYAEGASKAIRPGDREWEPLLAIILQVFDGGLRQSQTRLLIAGSGSDNEACTCGVPCFSDLEELHSEMEEEASWLAGALLIPRDRVLTVVRSDSTIATIAAHYGASETSRTVASVASVASI